jgi:hypothetical protein
VGRRTPQVDLHTPLGGGSVAVVAPARPRPGGVTVELDVETLTITHGLEVDGVMMA